MNNQIEELKNDLDTMVGNGSQLKAEKLYAKGWRKQSEDTIELPCKLGQTVWAYNQLKNNVYKNTVDAIHIRAKSPHKNKIRLEYRNAFGELSYRTYTWAQIGKQVFFTEQEAVEALVEQLRKGGE